MNVRRKAARVFLCALFLVTLSTFLTPATAEAQARFGVRAGVSADPDQFYIGAHGESGPLIHSSGFARTSRRDSGTTAPCSR